MKITRNNYEQYAIDYLENNLDSATLREFELFLRENPNIEQELSEIQDFFYVEINDVVFDNKYTLKQSPIKNIDYIDYLIISDIEKTITEEEKIELEELKENYPEIEKEYETYLKTKALNKDVVFDNKYTLKQSPIENIDYVDYLIISDIEKTITEEEKQDLEELKKNYPKVKKEYETFTKTIVTKTHVVFNDKDSLKRSNRIYLSSFISVAVAASLVIFWGIFLKPNKTTDAISPESYAMHFETRNVVIPDTQEEQDNIIYYQTPNDGVEDSNDIIINNEPNYEIVVAENFDSLQKNIYITSNEIICSNISKARKDIIYDFTRKRNQDLFDNLNPVVVINALFKGYEAATENDDLNLKLAYDKSEKQVNLEVKNKIYEVSMP